MAEQDNNINFTPQEGIAFTGFPTSNPSIIKVIGVGGGGDNAVNHMYNEGIHDVTYVVVNTDKKALQDSPVPNKLQLGPGLGAGNMPEKGRQLALENKEQIKEMLNDGTQMVFITAGMGGGTGTGASPVIAQCAQEMGLLTVGIVTIPFLFELSAKINKALDGVDELSKHVDALLVINNERLRKIYPELTITNAFKKADETLTVAARSIADIINMHGIINLDFQDVTTILKDGGVAVMSTGYGEGENRVTKAIEEALKSPLLGKTDVYNSKKLLLNICIGGGEGVNELTIEEMGEVNDFTEKFNTVIDQFKWGLSVDPALGDKVKITILATGFGLDNVDDRYKTSKGQNTKEQLDIERDIKDRIDSIYGAPDESHQRPRPQIYLLQPQDMDNDDLISSLEASTTYSRTKAGLEQLQKKSEQAQSEPAERTEQASETMLP